MKIKLCYSICHMCKLNSLFFLYKMVWTKLVLVLFKLVRFSVWASFIYLVRFHPFADDSAVLHKFRLASKLFDFLGTTMSKCSNCRNYWNAQGGNALPENLVFLSPYFCLSQTCFDGEWEGKCSDSILFLWQHVIFMEKGEKIARMNLYFLFWW